MTTTQPKQLSPSGDILNRLQALGEPLLKSVAAIKRDDRLSPSAKSEDIAALVGGHDVMLDNAIEDARDEANSLLSSAQQSLTLAQNQFQDQIAGVGKDAGFTERSTILATIEPLRTRVAVEASQLLAAFGGDDGQVARWSMSVIEDAKNGGRESRFTLDWLRRVGLHHMKNQSQNGDKFLTTSQLITDAHSEVFDSSKIRAAKANIREAREKLDAVQSAQRNFLPDIRRNRDYRIKEMR